MFSSDYYYKYKDVYRELKNDTDIHIHCMSGSAYTLTKLVTLYPDLKAKVTSQIYDSPAHVMATVPSLEKMYKIPKTIGEPLVRNIFTDCVKVSNEFPNKSLIPNVTTGIIHSTNDFIAPKEEIDKMITNWSKDNDIELLSTDSLHLNSFRDYPEKYKQFCLNIYNK